jgi:hypothetical protein
MAAGVVKYYAIDLSYMWSLYDGEFRCGMFATKGDADLFFKFGALPSPHHDKTNDCESITAGSSKESCCANYTLGYEIKSTNAFVAIYSSTKYDGLAINCAKFFPPVRIRAGEEILSSPRVGEVLQYVLHNVKAGETVKCTVKEGVGCCWEDREGEDADADLYVRFGQPAEPYSWSTANDCMSVRPSSNEACKTKPARKATAAYVAITSTNASTVLEDYYYFNPAMLKCSVTKSSCLAKGATCTAQDQCCSVGTTNYSCDGPPGGKHTCKVCKLVNKTCSRDSKCCSGKCLSGSCNAEKKKQS